MADEEEVAQAGGGGSPQLTIPAGGGMAIDPGMADKAIRRLIDIAIPPDERETPPSPYTGTWSSTPEARPGANAAAIAQMPRYGGAPTTPDPWIGAVTDFANQAAARPGGGGAPAEQALARLTKGGEESMARRAAAAKLFAAETAPTPREAAEAAATSQTEKLAAGTQQKALGSLGTIFATGVKAGAQKPNAAKDAATKLMALIPTALQLGDQVLKTSPYSAAVLGETARFTDPANQQKFTGMIKGMAPLVANLFQFTGKGEERNKRAEAMLGSLLTSKTTFRSKLSALQSAAQDVAAGKQVDEYEFMDRMLSDQPLPTQRKGPPPGPPPKGATHWSDKMGSYLDPQGNPVQ